MSAQSPVLLAVFAHPDDESYRCGGTLALLAQRGIQVQIISATRGDAGSCGEPPLCRAEELGELREQELRCACATLGIAQPIILGYSDGKLAEANEKEAVTRIYRVIRNLSPKVILTWPPDGLSGHPDHATVSYWTKLAFQNASSDKKTQIAIYHLAIPHSAAKKLNLTQLYSIPDKDISLVVDVAEVWKQKMAAIHCHRTQAIGSPILAASEEKQRVFFGYEYFTRAIDNKKGDFLQGLQT